MKSKFPLLLLLTVLLALGSAKAQDTKLVVILNIENMRPDYLQRYQPNFKDGGFKLLMDKGAYCSNAKMNLYSQNKSAATATLFTGCYPNMNGIINSEWVKDMNGQREGVIFDNNYLVVGTSSNADRCSAEKLLTPTIGDELKLLSNGRSRVYSVAADAQTAVLSAGHAADGGYWLDDESGKMISTTYYMETFPAWANTFNNRRFASKYFKEEWDRSLFDESSYAASDEDDSMHEEGFPDYKKTFPYDMSKLQDIYEDFSALKHTPYINTLITEFATTLIKNEYLGMDKTPDLVTVNYSSLQSEFGPQSIEMEDCYIKLDREIANLLKSIDERVGLENTLVVLTSNNGASYPASYLESLRIPSGIVKPDNISALLRSYLNVSYGQADWVKATVDQEIYLNRELIKEKELDIAEIRQKAAEFVSQFQGVNLAMSASQLANNSYANGLQKNFANSFKTQRSGDVLFSIDPSWLIDYRFKGMQSNDKRIALMMMGSKVQHTTLRQEVDAVDMVPTILQLLGFSPASNGQGQVIRQLIK